MNIRQIGIDIGKTTVHVIALGTDERIVLRKQFSRSQLIRYFEIRGDEALDVGHASD